MRAIVATLIFIVTGCASSITASEKDWRFPTDRITQEQWQTYLDETRALPEVRNYEAANQIVVEDPTNNTVYVFTTPSHPAFPAVVKRHVIQKGIGVFIERKGYYAGDKDAYDRWWHEFDALDQRLKESIGK